VLLGEHLALLVDARHQVAAAIGQQHPYVDRRPGQLGSDQGARNSSMPSPVRADTTTLCGSRRRSRSMTIGSARSALLMTTSSGTWCASMSASTVRTAASCDSGVGVGAVDDVQDQVGVRDLLQVERNASTRSCGRWRTKPTVSGDV
jgi:hypothetical protein